MKIRFWQNIISPHQVDVFEALASMVDVEVSLVVQEKMTEDRLNLGWNVPTLSNINVEQGITDTKIETLLDEKKDIEIFTAPWGYPSLRQSFRKAIWREDARVALMSEPGIWKGLSGMLRVGRGRVHSTIYGQRLSFILAIGDLAVTWFQKCQYPKNIIYPYAYTTSTVYENKGYRESGVFKIIYVGQLSYRKGLDLLLFALKKLGKEGWQLRIVGDGPSRSYLQLISKIFGLEDCISFHGVINNEKVKSMIGESDLLVLPSRWDGWGAVVNEALHCGTPAVCSDSCGAKAIIEDSVNGRVFKTNNIDELSKTIEMFWESPCDETRRTLIQKKSKKFSGKSVANYLVEIIEYSSNNELPRPIAPWKTI